MKPFITPRQLGEAIGVCESSIKRCVTAILALGGDQAAKLRLPRCESVYVGRSMAELEALVQGIRLAHRSQPQLA